jgi:hypothetical protein
VIVLDIPNWQLFQLLASTVFPLLVGLVTTRVTDGGHKAIMLAALSVSTSLATELGGALQTGTAYNLGTALLFGLGSFLVAVGTYYGAWRPTGIAVAAQSVLVKASPQEVAAAEQAKALETIRKAGVDVQPTAPADRVPGPDHSYDGQ